MNQSLYDRLIAEVFARHHGSTVDEFEFEREELAEILGEWGERVRNLGDVPYTYRGGRRALPDAVLATGDWIIEGRGRGRYALRRLSKSPFVEAPEHLQSIAILDATPDIILKFGGTDEQGLLTRVRYNRLLDTFLGITTYHLQSHIRAYVRQSGQVEIDDLYFGVDKLGTQYVAPVEAKTADEPLGLVQIATMNAFAMQRYPLLALLPVAIREWKDGSMFFYRFSADSDCEKLSVVEFKRYHLVSESGELVMPGGRERRG